MAIKYKIMCIQHPKLNPAVTSSEPDREYLTLNEAQANFNRHICASYAQKIIIKYDDNSENDSKIVFIERCDA